MAITNCLNFGNPKRPEVFYQFREAVGGMGDACRVLGTPVTGGNVSLYNESPTGSISRETAYTASFRAEWAHFQAAAQGEASVPSLQDQVTLHKVLDAIYRSALEGKSVQV